MSHPFTPIADVPPKGSSKRSKYTEALAWCDEHPNEWILLEGIWSAHATKFRQRGYESTCRNVNPKGIADVYVRRVQS